MHGGPLRSEKVSSLDFDDKHLEEIAAAVGHGLTGIRLNELRRRLQQAAFWVRLYENRVAVTASAVESVKAMLVQPQGAVVNAAGEQPFSAPWRAGTVVSAKTGSATDRTGRGVRWLSGHVTLSSRSWVFVSCVIGPPDVAPNAAIDLAAGALREAGVL